MCSSLGLRPLVASFLQPRMRPTPVVWVRANDSTATQRKDVSSRERRKAQPVSISGETLASQLYKSACIVAGGTHIWLANLNDQAVRGTFEVSK
jgi:hypothetical protein